MAKLDSTADKVSTNLLNAAHTRRVVTGVDPWDYGWNVESYRRSPGAAISSPVGSIALTEQGVMALEEAVAALLKDKRVNSIWAEEDLWPLVASAISTIPIEMHPQTLEKTVSDRVARILNPGSTVVAFAVSNVIWEGPPAQIGEAVIGEIGPEWLSAVQGLATDRGIFESEYGKRWALRIEHSACEPAPDDSDMEAANSEEVGHVHQAGHVCGARFPRDVKIPRPTVFATKSRYQFGRSIAHASGRFDDIVDLSLLLEAGTPEGVKTNRPAFSRPARRGLVLDRVAIEHAIARTAHVGELASNTLICSPFGVNSTASWHEANPLELAPLLSNASAVAQIETVVKQDSPLSRRLRIAARWYSQAHWSEQDIDAVLALGIALDALVGDKSGLSTSALAERYGLLEPVRIERSYRSSEFREMYQVRSAVAHGSLTSTKVDSVFRAKMVAAVRWATQRIVALDEQFSPVADTDVRTVFEDLRWGTAQWAR